MYLIVVSANRFVKNNMVRVVTGLAKTSKKYYYYIARETKTNIYNMHKVVINRLS